jgi:hypothetical protein
MTRFWSNGQPIKVFAPDPEAPQRSIWDRRSHEVDAIAAKWRVDVEWWRARIWRDYFKLTTRDGLLVELYHDLMTDEWRLQRLYD